jgi:hypothetical protein
MAGTHSQTTSLRLALSSAVFLAALAASPLPAHAVTLFAKPDVATTSDMRVCLGATEPAGLGLLLVDGKVVRTAQLAPSRPATFTAVPLAPGQHRLRVLVRSAAGLTESAPMSVRAWTAPAAPALGGLHVGLYPVDTPLTVGLGSSTTRVSASLGGKGLWTKYVTGPSRFGYTFRLGPGSNTICLASANPASATKRSFTLNRALWPVPGQTEVGSEFGMRDGRMHKGIDILAPYGSKVIAAGAGRVVWAKDLTSYGGLVMIDHGNKLTTYYAHLSRIDVTYGQWVTAGQQIGAVGIANVAHLHFQTYTGGLAWGDTSDMYRRVNSGTPQDPRIYVGRP